MNITCGTTSTTVASNIDTAIYIPGACTPTVYNSPASDYRLDNFSLTGASGTSINDNGPASHPNNGYEDRVGVVSPITLMQSSTYSGSVTYNPSSTTYENQIWIDFNDNGTFETSEEVTPPFGDPSTTTSGASFTLTISPTATLGNHRMRIRTINMHYYYSLSTHVNPCSSYDSYSPYNSYYYGTTRDYIANIVPLPDCSGTPTAGTVTTTATAGCGTITANLGLTGQTDGFGGLTYQWQSSPDNATWSNISGATAKSVTITTVTTTYYRMNIGCTLSSSSATSATSMVLTVNPIPAAITGPSSMCSGGSTITLSDVTGSGTWSSGNTAVATIDASGVVTPVAGGIVPISYTVTATGCYITTPIAVISAPTASTITPSTSQTVCLGNGATFTAASTVGDLTLLDQNFNSGLTGATGGTWTINNISGTSTTYWAIRTPPGYSGASLSGDGTPYMQAAPDAYVGTTNTNFVSPSFSTVGYSAATLTYNQNFHTYSGDATVAVEYSIDGGSTWSTLYNQLGTYVGGTTWSASVPTNTVTLPAAAIGQSNVMLRWNYVSYYGYYWTIDNIKLNATPSINYTWTPAGAATGLSCTACTTTTISPTATGANVYSVTASAAGCASPAVGATVSVNPLPLTIGGTGLVCAGATTTLGDASAGGTWQSDNTSVGTIGSNTGIVSGIAAGTANISYVYTTTGCRVTKVVTVDAQPTAIGGTTIICEGVTSSLTNSIAGGSWSSSNPTVAAIDVVTGVLTGASSGFGTVTYQMPAGCYVTTPVTVNPIATATLTPSAPAVCIGNSVEVGASALPPTITLLAQDFNSGTLGGWTINNFSGPGTSYWNIVDAPSAVTFAAGDGTKMMEGNASDAAAVGTYVSTILTSPSFSTVGYDSAMVTFNQYLISFPGDAAVAVEYSIDGGTTWTTMLDQSGLTAGSDTWTASSPDVSIALPTAAMGASNVQLRWNYNASSFFWDIDNIVVSATQSAPSFTWTPIGAATGLGCTTCATNTITPTTTGANVYSVTTTTTMGCSSYTTVTVNVNPPVAAIGGTPTVCVDGTTTLTNGTTGGAWSSSVTGTATVDPTSGVVTGVAAGVATITYQLTGGAVCYTTIDVTVNPLPAIGGTGLVCIGYPTALTDSAPSGTWSSAAPGIATVDATTGIVTGVTMGNTHISYTLPGGCATSTIVTVNPLPAPIAGIAQACEGSSSIFSDGSAGGTWSSSTPLVADISTTGSVTAYAAGTTMITYTLSTGCLRTRVFTVNVQPAAIDGTPKVCQAGTTTLSNTTTGGMWVSGIMPIATVSTTGVVSGLASGVAPVSYVMSSGCQSVVNVTVNAMPSAIAGATNVCEGLTTTLSSSPTGGIWISAAAGIAAVDSASGIATGMGVGTTTITYALPTGCFTTKDVVINQTPAAIVGTPKVCNGYSLTLTDTTTGGVWSSSNTAIATAGLFTGVFTGVTAGTANVSYTLLSGCASTVVLTVDATPAAITGPLNVCSGQTIGLASITTGGTWSSSNTTVATIGSTGSVTTVAPGNTTMSYTTSNGCATTAVVTVNALPAIHNVTGGGTYCAGGTGVHVGVDTTNSGINYQLMSGSTTVGAAVAGTGSSIDFGAITPAGTYSVVANSASTGCASNMSGTATVVIGSVVTPTATLSLGTSDTVCEGNSATLTASTTDGGATPTYVWRVNGITVIGATSSTYNYIPGNGDIVTMTMTSSNGCAMPATAMATKTLAVNPKMMPLISATAAPGLVVCEGNTVTFNATATYGGSSPVFTWMKNSSVAGTGSTFAYIPANGDIVYVVLASDYVCRLADSVQSLHVTMTTNAVYVPAVTITANPGFTFAAGTSVTLTANVSSGGPTPTLQWYIGSVAISSATNSTFTSASFNNGDSVSCQVTGSGTCGLSAFNSVIMRYSGVGVASTGNVSDVRLMPNPNKGEFIVKGTLAVKADREVAIEVTNMLGQVVYHGTTVAHDGNIDCRIKLDNTLANGMYILNVMADNEKQVFHFVLEQ
jgi:uncharacterized protein YjdB